MTTTQLDNQLDNQLDTPPQKTPEQRATDVIQAMDRNQPDEARASLEFLREQLRLGAGVTIDIVS